MEQAKITLAIFGNQNSNSGFQPLFWINNPPQQLENMVPPGMEENPYFFVLQTGTSFTQFTLIQNHVSSYMSSRAGVLKIAICIPAGFKLANNTSPLSVLLSVRKLFIDTCMTQKSALTGSYNFKEKLAPPEEFIALLDSYTLVAAVATHRPMTGTDDALLLLSEEQTSELFKDVQYPQFTAYRQIVVAPTGNSSTYAHVINGLQIPRHSQLQLVVNGRVEQWPVADYYNEVTTINLNLNKRYWDFTPVSFSVNQLLANPIHNPAQGVSVYIDPASESVICNITPHKKVVTIQVAVEGCPHVADILRSLTIQAGPRRTVMPLTPQGTFQLMGDDIIYLATRELKPVLTTNSYSIVGTTVIDQVIHVAVQPNKVTPPSGLDVSPTLTQKATSASSTTAPIKAMKPTWKKWLPWIVLASIVVLLALVTVLLFLPGKDARLATPQEAGQNDMTGEDMNNETTTFDEETEEPMPQFSEEKLNTYNNLLKDPSLTFAQIDEMAEWVSHEDIARACTELNANFVSRVRNYKQIKDLLLTGDIDGALSIHDTQGKPLYIVHYWQIRAAIDGWVDENGIKHMYQGDSKKKASEEYKEKSSQLQSFLDIWDIHNTGARKLDDTSLHSETGKRVDGWPVTRQGQGDQVVDQPRHRSSNETRHSDPRQNAGNDDEDFEIN